MMDGAYFTSRNELLTFFNTLLNLNLTKIEQTASGAVACQLTEYLFPNSIPMSRVNWAAKSSHEYVGNYKLLQKAFTKNKVQRYVDVDKLIRGKYQDNLEFCQWLKAFFDMQNGGGAGREGYDAVAVRAKGKGGKMVGMNKGGGGGNAGNSNSSSSRARAPVRSSSSVSASSGRSGNNAPVVGKARIGSSASSSTTSSSSAARPAAASRSSPRKVTSSSSASTTTSTARSARPTRERPAPTQKENNSATNLPTITRKPTTTTTSSSSSSVSTAQVKNYQEEITTLKSQTTTLQTQVSELQVLSTELEMSINTVESERDFYFEKLRGIEVMLQVYKEKEESGEVVLPVDGSGNGGGEMKMVIDKIFKVMYAAAEDNVVVDDEGNVS
jgi:microtubule-associated protein, RP/EB family